MRVRSTIRWVFAFGVLTYFASASPVADAQPTSSTTPGGASNPAGAGASADAQVGFQRKTQLTPQEQVAESTKHLARMEAAGGGVRKMLEDARKARDVVRTLCLNDKLSQVDVAIRSGRDRRQALQAAANRNDAELSSHEFTILTVLRQRVEQLVAEANQCVGEEAAFVGDTRVTTTVDPAIPPDQTPYPSTDPTIVVAPPPCTSCTL